MTAGEVLAGLDEVPWAQVKGEEIPGLLRGVVAGDPDALYELGANVIAGGVIWEASSYVVPFLVRLALAGIETLEMVGMLGPIAASGDEVGVTEPGRARREFAAQADALVDLRDHGDPRVRAKLAWTLAQHPDGAAWALPVLREWWEDGEADRSVRCALLRVMLELDAATAASLAVAIEGDPGPGELVMAAWACAAGGEPWTPLLHDAATAWVSGGLGLRARWWEPGASEHDPFTRLLCALAARGDADSAEQLAADALTLAAAAGRSGALQDVVWAVREFTQAYQAALDTLAVVLARAESMLPPPTVRRWRPR